MNELEKKYKEKYLKYKEKYLKLSDLNNLKTYRGGTPTKRPSSIVSPPVYKIGISKTFVTPNPENTPENNENIDTSNSVNLKESITPLKSVNLKESSTPITPLRTSYRNPVITPSKDVNKDRLYDILNSDIIKMICNNNNFYCKFKDKRYKGDGCVLELYTEAYRGLSWVNVGHITVHKGKSNSSAKSFHYKSDDFSNDSVNFNVVIAAKRDAMGKYLTLGMNSMNRLSSGFDELIWKYRRLRFGDLGNRIQKVVMDIISYLNSLPDEIFYDPL